jgi:hypothetical protein
MTTVKSLVEELLSDEDEIDEFGKWAFGKYYRSIVGSTIFLEAWNSIHEKDFKLSLTGDMYEDMKRMVELWRKSKSTS